MSKKTDSKNLGKADKPTGSSQLDKKPTYSELERKIEELRLEVEFQRKQKEDILNFLPIPVYELDLEGRIIYANDKTFETFRFPKEEFEPEKFRAIDMIAKKDHEKLRKKIEASLQETNNAPTEYTALRKDKSEFEVLIYSMPIIKEGKTLGLRGAIIDISEYKKMLRGYSEFVESIKGNIFELDSQLRYTKANSSYLKKINNSEEAIKGTYYPDSIYSEERETFLKKIEKAKQTKQAVVYQYTSKEEHYFRAIIPEISHEGEIKNYKIFCLPLKEIIKKEEERIKSQNQTKLMELLNTFINDALSNRLNGIVLNLELMKIFSGLPENFEKPIENATEEILYLMQGLREYQDISRFAGETTKETYSGLGDLIKTIKEKENIRNYHGETIYSARKIKFDYENKKGHLTLDEIPKVIGNAQMVSTALTEIILNAVESYEPKEKKEKDTDYKVEISAIKEKDYITIKIKDYGIGMDEKLKASCLEPFQKGENVKESRRLGFGAYLANIAMLYCAGNIEIESLEEKGTTFSLKFRIAD